MKDVKNLIVDRTDGGMIYRCSTDGVLVEIHDGSLHSIKSCPHFQWYQLTKACYYLGIGDIPEDELQKLRKNSISVLHEGMYVYILLPTQT